MFRSSRRRAGGNGHPSLWPLYALRTLVLWAGVAGASYGIIWALFGGPPVLVLVIGLWAAFAVFSLGIVPAVLLALLDVAFVGRRNRSPSRYTNSPRGAAPGAQLLTSWAIGGALIGAATGAGYAVVYLNAFAPAARLTESLGTGLMAGAAAGLAAGWLTAVKLNMLDRYARSESLSQTVKRGAFLWAATVAGGGGAAYLFTEYTAEQTLLPAALLALIGAGVLPQLAAAPPVDLAQIPPPPIPTVPSPGPENPEGGLGEGARGNWADAPPPQVPSITPTSSDVDSGAERNESWITH